MADHEHEPEVFDPACRGCGPTLIDLSTGEVYADDHPIMAAVLAAWKECPVEEQRAFYLATRMSRRDPDVQRLCESAVSRMQLAMASVTAPQN